MTAERVEELIEILRETVDDVESLRRFIETYGRELDEDFLTGISNALKGAFAKEDQDEATFFMQVGRMLSLSVMTSGHTRGDRDRKTQDNPAGRARNLIRSMLDEVASVEDLERFSTEHLHEFDDVFFTVLGQLAEQMSARGEDESHDFVTQVGQFLQAMRQNMNPAHAGIPVNEAEVKAENDSIGEILDSDPNEAFARARVNFDRALQTGNDRLIMSCAFILGASARRSRPYPKLPEAIDAFQIAAEKAQAIGHQSAYAMAQTDLGKSYADLPTENRRECLLRAIQCYEIALGIFTEDNLEDLAMVQNCLGVAYSKLPSENRGDNLEKAVSYYKSALIFYTEIDYPYQFATIQHNLGITYIELPTGNWEENVGLAFACFENALRVYSEKEYPKNYAMVQNSLGGAFEHLHTGNRGENLERAIVCYQKALRVFTENDLPLQYAITQNNLGTAYSSLPTGERDKNLRRSIVCYENALRVYSEEKFPEDCAMIQHNLGTACLDLTTGDPGENVGKAIDYLKDALRVRTKIGFPYQYATTQNSLGNAYLRLPLGDPGKNISNAIACYQDALSVHTQEDFPQDYATTQNNLGNVYAKLAERDGCRSFGTTIQGGCKPLTCQDFHPRASRMSRPAKISEPERDPAENLGQAIACYEKALKIFTEKDFPERYATTQRNLGTVFSDLFYEAGGEESLKQAIHCYENALRVCIESEFPQQYATVQHDLGNAYFQLLGEDRKENIERAIMCYENSLRVRAPTHFPGERVRTLFRLAMVYDDLLNDCQRAYDACEEAITTLERHIRAVSSSDTRRALAKKQADIYDRIVSLCFRLGRPAEALSYVERAKSRTLVEMLHSAQLQPSETVPEGLRRNYLSVRAKLEQLCYRQQSGDKACPRDFIISEDHGEEMVFRTVPVRDSSPRRNIWELIGELQDAYNRLLEQIRRLDPVFAASESVPHLSVSDIEALIPEGTIFVDCFTGENGTYVFVLDGKNDLRDTHLLLKDLTSTELFDHIALDNWLRPYDTWLQTITLTKADRLEADRAWFNCIESVSGLLAEKFWYATDDQGKSLALLVENSGAERIVFFPHTGLHLLPLHLIPLSRNGQGERLMDRFEIAFAPSASMLRLTLNRPKNDFDRFLGVANPDCSLSFSDNEVRTIAGRFIEPRILWHEEATKRAVIEGAEQANVIHFSCHGNFTAANPLDSHLKLAEEKLTLREIFSNLKLPNACAVVLAACETGMVKLELGDEYIGLTSGFLYAGAPSVISSLWAVSDHATNLLMQRWYENVLLRAMGKAAALREAQRWVRDLKADPAGKGGAGNSELSNYVPEERPFAHPCYWGAFVCTGNWS